MSHAAVAIVEEPIDMLSLHAGISIAFEVRSVFDVVDREPAGTPTLHERPVAAYTKDYDAIRGEGPVRWLRRFDVTRWGLLAAYLEGRRVGGAVLAFDTPGVHLLEGRRDLAVLWDLRICPGERGRGIGTALFAAAERWARQRGCSHLKVETQNINVPACRFYQRRGCILAGAHRSAYPECPEEVQLLWYKSLHRLPPSG